MTLDQLTESILALPNSSRAFLAEKLLESIDYEEELDVSEDWKNEALRRAKEIDDGVVECVPADELFSELQGRLSV